MVGASVTVVVAVSEIVVVCSTVESAGTSPVAVRVIVAGAGTTELVTVTSFVKVFKLVCVTGFCG